MLSSRMPGMDGVNIILISIWNKLDEIYSQIYEEN